MTALIVIGCILAFLLILALLRVGAEAEYSEEGFALILRAGPVHLQILPAQKREKREKKRRKKAKKEKPQRKKTGGSLEMVLKAVPAIKEFLSRFVHKLTINDLTVYFVSASNDPYKAAMNFGYVSAAAGIIVPILENSFKIKNRDIRTDVSFDMAEPYIYLNAAASIAIWEVFYCAWVVVRFALSYFVKQNRKAVNENGKASHRRSDGDHNVEDKADGRRQHRCRSAHIDP